jgi:hypothetical protein
MSSSSSRTCRPARSCTAWVSNVLWQEQQSEAGGLAAGRAYLEGKDMGAEVLEGQLELPGLAAEQDLDGDGRVEGDGDRGRGSHGERGRLTT